MTRRPRTATEQIPSLSWDVFYPHFRREFQQGEHVTILGGTGSGKTTLALEVLEARDHILFLATKREDPLIEGLSERGYRISDQLDIRVRDGKVIDRKFVFWPVRTSSRVNGRERHLTMEEFRDYQRREITRALEYVWRTRRWAVFADETTWLSERGEGGLGLGSQLNTLWYQGRSARISLIAATQRPSWIPRAASSSPEHLFFFATNDKADLERLSDIGAGVDKKLLEATITSLKRFEFLYFRPRERPPLLVRSKVTLE